MVTGLSEKVCELMGQMELVTSTADQLLLLAALQLLVDSHVKQANQVNPDSLVNLEEVETFPDAQFGYPSSPTQGIDLQFRSHQGRELPRRWQSVTTTKVNNQTRLHRPNSGVVAETLMRFRIDQDTIRHDSATVYTTPVGQPGRYVLDLFDQLDPDNRQKFLQQVQQWQTSLSHQPPESIHKHRQDIWRQQELQIVKRWLIHMWPAPLLLMPESSNIEDSLFFVVKSAQDLGWRTKVRRVERLDQVDWSSISDELLDEVRKGILTIFVDDSPKVTGKARKDAAAQSQSLLSLLRGLHEDAWYAENVRGTVVISHQPITGRREDLSRSNTFYGQPPIKFSE